MTAMHAGAMVAAAAVLLLQEALPNVCSGSFAAARTGNRYCASYVRLVSLATAEL
jgi:hypothetical protein